MSQIFWVTCPKCQGRFCAHYRDFRHTDRKLLCPYCSLRFDQSESPRIEE